MASLYIQDNRGHLRGHIDQAPTESPPNGTPKQYRKSLRHKCPNCHLEEKVYKLSDGGGLYLLVNPNGSTYWRLKYRLHGKEKKLALGVYPTVSLANARIATQAAKERIHKGGPGTARKQEKATKALNTFRIVAEDWVNQQKEMWTETHAKRVLDSLKADVFPTIGGTPIQHVKTLDCLAVVRAVEGRGALDVAGWVKQRMSSVFRYAVHTARIEINPADQLRGVIATRKVTHRASLKADALPGFLRHLEDYPGQLLTKLALQC